MFRRRTGTKPAVYLKGPGGNAYALLGMARRLADQFGLDREAVTKEMAAGDYRHMLAVFDRYFGDYVDLVTEEEPDGND